MQYCPECCSDDIEEEETGYVCAECGATFSHESTNDDYEEIDSDELDDEIFNLS